MWANMMDVNTTALVSFNNKMIVDPGICGLSANIILDGPCMADALKTFKSCIHDRRFTWIQLEYACLLHVAGAARSDGFAP